MFPKWVNKYIGLPFEQVNCWQLVCLIYKERFDIELPFLDNEYASALDRENIKKLYEREIPLNWRPVGSPVVGNVIALRVEDQPWHCGIVIAKDTMLHTQYGMDSVWEKFNGLIWKNRIIGFYNYVG